jgi:dihydrofolate reductase
MAPHITLVLARATNGVIGNKGGLPWRLSEDMKRFKELTLGKPVVMGRKTWDSLPRKPLPGRRNIVITRNADFQVEGADVVLSLDGAIAAAENAAEIMIIGGAEIYRQALPIADKIELTEIEASPEGDTRMAPFSPDEWQEQSRQAHQSADGLRYSYVTLLRRSTR